MKLTFRRIRVDDSAFNGNRLDWLSQVGVTVRSGSPRHWTRCGVVGMTDLRCIRFGLKRRFDGCLVK